VRPLALLLLLVTALLGSAPEARAGEGTALDAKARLKRRADLRTAAGRWVTHRMRFPSRCPVCQGAGGIPGRQNGRPAMVTCVQCKGKRAWISPDDYRAVYYELKSGAFQALPDIKPTLEAQYKEASQGRPWPKRFKRYRVREWQLLDDTHGVVWFVFDQERAPTATYWIFAPGAKGKPEWCSYDSRADGAWPGAEAPTPAPSTVVSGVEDVPAAEAAALRGQLAGITSAYRVTDFRRRGAVLCVGMEPRRDDVTAARAELIGLDALALVEGLLAMGIPGAATGGRVETEWRTPWRDPDGIERLKPTWTATLDHAALPAAGWSTLAAPERLKLLAWTPHQHPGWTPVVGKASKPVPSAPVTEDPPAPEPAAPQATEPPPMDPEPAPAPQPPPPTPASPPVAPPTAPAQPPAKLEPPPELTAKARKDAEAALAKMRAVLTEAKAIYDESVLARQGGAHDLWQEKLSEVRSRLGEIDDIWNEDLVAAMPGNDAQKEELAEEHFGGIWNEVYELKSIVRKTSAIH
jgi:hypothetical protein